MSKTLPGPCEHAGSTPTSSTPFLGFICPLSVFPHHLHPRPPAPLPFTRLQLCPLCCLRDLLSGRAQHTLVRTLPPALCGPALHHHKERRAPCHTLSPSNRARTGPALVRQTALLKTPTHYNCSYPAEDVQGQGYRVTPVCPILGGPN